ncbi:fimbria/pilus periplasmic chaperone [Serratia fonticola]
MKTYSSALLTCSLTMVALLAGVISFPTIAGGVSLGSTRIIYPANGNQVSLTINNSDDKSRFLINSWVEDRDGKKSTDFTVYPPLFMINPGNENVQSIKFDQSRSLPSDRETLYWFNAQAIPQQHPAKGENVLQLASLSRIKMFVRPAGLEMKAIDAPQHIHFSRKGNQLVVNNPTPYHITLVGFMDGKTALPNTMVPPKDSVVLDSKANGPITFRTINDYGAITPEQNGVMK